MKPKTKKINNLVSDLITKCENHNKEIHKRFTICDIFTNLESKTFSGLHTYISESNIRFKKAKCGGNVPSLIKTSSKKLLPLNNQILSARIYSEYDMNKEKSQLRHKLKHKEGKEIPQIMSEVKECTTHYTSMEKKLRERFNKGIEVKKTIVASNTNPNILSSNNSNYLNCKTNSNYNSQVYLSPLQSARVNEENMQVIKDLFTNELETVNNQINIYKRNVQALTNKLTENNGDYKQDHKSKENELFANTNANHLNRKIKMLTYKKPVVVVKPKIKKKEIFTEPIDLNKVVRFVKPTKYELSLEKKKRKNRNNKINIDNINNSLTERHNSLETKHVVKNIAYKSFSLNETMRKKQRNLEIKIHDKCLPKIAEYESILQSKVEDEKQKRKEYNNKNCKCLTEDDTKREVLRHKLKDKMLHWNIPLEVLQGI